MSEYSAVRVGKLRLKGAAGAGLKAKKKRKRRRGSQEGVAPEDLRHGMLYGTSCSMCHPISLLHRRMASRVVSGNVERSSTYLDLHRRLYTGSGHWWLRGG